LIGKVDNIRLLDTALVLRLFIAAGLVAANAFFVVTEFSFVRVRPTRLRELAAQGEAGAQGALRLIEHMDALLAAVQLGVTMASLGLGWAGEETVAQILTPLLGPGIGHLVALAIAFLGISVMHIIFGELVPKSLALARADRLALAVARPMELFVAATWPVMRFVNRAASAVSKTFGATATSSNELPHSADELKLLISAGRKVGTLPPEQEAMIHRVFDLDEVLAREIMTPRPDMVYAPVTATLEELVHLVLDSQYSRIPVYEETPDKILGILLSKELFQAWSVQLKHGTSNFNLRQWLHPPMIVPDTKPLGNLLEEFREKRRRMAMVVDEFGRIAGLVTVEDVIEAIVGEIEDEYDSEVRRLSPADAPTDLDGATSLLDLENLYGVELPRDRGFETLGGFALWRLGEVPKGGEVFEYEGWRFKILEMDRRRIGTVRVEKA
jgi:CBS domain containing-hemolysin-like protein